MKKLINYFKGERVTIFISSLTMTEFDNNSGTSHTGNIMIEGVIIDYDEQFLYLGEDLNGEVLEAVKVGDIARIMKFEPPQEFIPDLDGKQWN